MTWWATDRIGYRDSPLEVMAYDAEDRFATGSSPFNAEELVRSKLSRLVDRS